MVSWNDGLHVRADTLHNTTSDGIIVIDASGAIESFNDGAERIFGYSEAEVIGRNVSMLVPSLHHEAHARIVGIGREVTGCRRDGTVFPVHLAVREIRIGGDRKFVGRLHDLTKRAGLEGALGASEARWRAIIDSAVDGIIVIDAHGRIETFNPAAERLFGHEEQEVLGRNVDMLMPSPHREEHDRYLSRYLATGKARVIGVGREVQGLRKDGTTFPLHLSVGQIDLHGERKFTGILHDLTGRVQLEAQLRAQAALAALGEMAAVIAHEVKNPLAGIRGAVQVLGSRLGQEGAIPPVLKEIVTRIDSLDRMMNDLLLFARPPQPRLTPTDVVALVTGTANLLSLDPAMRELEIDVGGASPPVPADAEMLGIVFHNLLINGAQAIGGKGRIRVHVDTVDSTCRIAFSDDGPGIPVEVRDRIFTPFFTTKSRGSGLGLATAKRLIEAHSGHIAIDCPPAGGTTATVRIPFAAN